MLMRKSNLSISGCDQQWREKILVAGRERNYRKLGDLTRHLTMQLPPDFRLAVMLLLRFAPERLIRHIEDMQDVIFSVAVRDALGEDALQFALSVSDVTFKFVCASPQADMQVANAPEGAMAAVRKLLLQVAQTDLWRAWLLDFARYPKTDTIAEKVLSEALIQLTPTHWSAFVDAVELWTYEGTARSVSNILAPFLHALGREKSVEMWRFVFERWNKWDYDHDDTDKHLSAPSVCSFDYPVAMHYALLPLHEAQAEKTKLLESIATIEQKWFTDLSELATYRNRLSSRLRLVQHGLAIRNSPPESAGRPPPRIQHDNEFTEVRYRFFDVSAWRRAGE
jgi:hypothetical protein